MDDSVLDEWKRQRERLQWDAIVPSSTLSQTKNTAFCWLAMRHWLSAEALLPAIARMCKHWGFFETRHEARAFLQCLLTTTRAVDAFARAVEPMIRPAAVFKAARLAWVARLLQTEAERLAPLPQSALAYCLLYPLVDDFLDDPSNALRGRLVGALRSEEPVERTRSLSHSISQCLEALGDLAPIRLQLLHLLDVEMPSASIEQDELVSRALSKGHASLSPLRALLQAQVDHSECAMLGFLCQMLDDLQDIPMDRDLHIETAFTSAESLLPTAQRFLQLLRRQSQSAVSARVRFLAKAAWQLALEAVVRNETVFLDASTAPSEHVRMVLECERHLHVLPSLSRRHSAEWEFFRLCLQ